jgi:hypothetical protein
MRSGLTCGAGARARTREDARAGGHRVRQERRGGVLLVAGRAAEAAVAAGVAGRAVARDLPAVHAQRLQALLEHLILLAVLQDACARAARPAASAAPPEPHRRAVQAGAPGPPAAQADRTGARRARELAAPSGAGSRQPVKQPAACAAHRRYNLCARCAAAGRAHRW